MALGGTAMLARTCLPRYPAQSRDGRVAFRSKENLSPEQIRQRVNRIMDDWRSYSDFAQFFAALLAANNLTDRRFAQQYFDATGTYISASKVVQIRQGRFPPPYQLVAEIADHGLLSLDPDRTRPGGHHRIALFSTAGLIEVTPDSIKQWNADVLAGWQRHAQATTQPRTSWVRLINKLLSFHCQGGRWSRRDIAEVASTYAGPGCRMDYQRIESILSAPDSSPSPAERLALEHVIGLDSAQINAIETAVENGTLQLGRRPRHSHFSAQLADILDRLRLAGITQTQLALRTTPLGGTEPELSQSTMSNWKTGRSHPTQAALRVLAAALEQCRDRANCPLVSADDIRHLVSAAGFSLDELTATTHDIVAQIDGATRLKPLLSALRNAADLSVPLSAIDSDTARGAGDCMAHLLHAWEWNGSGNLPTPDQVVEIASRYNRLLRAGGKTMLTDDELGRIVDVARRNRQEEQESGFLQRALERHPPSSRRTISPDFDDGVSR